MSVAGEGSAGSPVLAAVGCSIEKAFVDQISPEGSDVDVPVAQAPVDLELWVVNARFKLLGEQVKDLQSFPTPRGNANQAPISYEPLNGGLAQSRLHNPRPQRMVPSEMGPFGREGWLITEGLARSDPRGVHLGHMAPRLRRPQRLVVWLIGAQAANTAFDAIALYPIGQSTKWGVWAKQWAKDDLDRLGFPTRFRFVFPIVKASSAVGLLFGLRWRALGRLTAAAIVTYFVAALGFHARAKDPAFKYVPAAGMLGWSLLALRSMKSRTT